MRCPTVDIPVSEVREVALCLLPTGSRDVQFDAEGKMPEGDLTILFEFKVTGKAEPLKGNGTPGVGTLYVNGAKVGSVDMDVTVPFLFSIEGLSIGHDYGDSVDHDNYKPTFPFTGTIKQVTCDLSGDAIRDAEAMARHTMSKQRA
jgi:hypothetical protein